jgi:hypothetical protein
VLQCRRRYSTPNVLQCHGAAIPPSRYRSRTVHVPSSSLSIIMSSDIVALPATGTEALKQRLDALVASISSPSVLMPSDIVALPAADAEVLKQRLDALVTAVKAAEEKVTAVRHHVLAARQLLDKE